MTLREKRSGQDFRSRSNHIQQKPKPKAAKLARPAANRRSACAGVTRAGAPGRGAAQDTKRSRHANMPSV